MISPAGLDDRYDDPDQLRDQVGRLLRYRATIALGVLLGLLGGLLLVVLRAGTYTSASEVLVRPRTDPFSTFGLAVDNQVSMATERQIALSATVAARAATALRQPARSDALSAGLRVTNAPDTQVLRFEYTAGTAKRAARVTNAFGEAYLADRQARSKSMIKRMTAGLEQQLTVLAKRLNAKKSGAPAAGTAGMQQQMGTLQKRISDISAYDTSGGDIVRRAEPAARPTGPGPGWLIPLGLIAGLVLALVLAWLRSAFEPRARSVGEVQGALFAPVLGILPAPGADGELLEVGRADGSRAEAYRTLAFRLRGGDGRTAMGTLMVVAPMRERGVEAVAVNLAAALAEFGDDVLLVDATGQTPGLSARLPQSADAAPTDVPEGAVVVDAGTAGRFTLCPDGGGTTGADRQSAPASSCTLPYAEAGRPTLFLSAPLLEHPEGLSLAQRVDGVLVVSALADTRRDDLKQLRELIDCSGGHIAGAALHSGAGRSLLRRVMDGDWMRRRRERISPTRPTASSASTAAAVSSAPSTPTDAAVEKPTAPAQDDTLAASR